jgi:hypothetical protein
MMLDFVLKSVQRQQERYQAGHVKALIFVACRGLRCCDWLQSSMVLNAGRRHFDIFYQQQQDQLTEMVYHAELQKICPNWRGMMAVVVQQIHPASSGAPNHQSNLRQHCCHHLMMNRLHYLGVASAVLAPLMFVLMT